MKRVVITKLLFCLCLFSSAVLSAPVDNKALEIIRRADEVRSPNKPFRYTLTIHEYKSGASQPDNKQVLDISIQICGMLEQAHAKGAIYLDHKLLHYYWNEYRQKVIMLDWNIGHWLPQTFSPEVQHSDLVQFSSRALHHIFTGRQAPGSVAVGPNRPEDIANAPTHYKASYSFDVQNRLNADEMSFLESALDGLFQTPTEMKEKLMYLYNKRQ